MRGVDIHEAKTRLSSLVEQAVNGEPFVISKAGKPLVKVMPLAAPAVHRVQRIGFMVGQIDVPRDFDRDSAEIARLFGGDA